MRRTAIWPRSVAALAGVAMSFTACGGGEDGEVVEVSNGQALYAGNCAMCHGELGLGNGPMAASLPIEPPSLVEHLGHHAEDQLVRIIRTGVPPAMPQSPLSEDEVKLVIDYTWTLVPDSLVEELREMQRLAEMGVEMGVEMPMGGAMDMPMDTTRR
jgi:mono/diheme cytochrome c family protein